MLAGDITNDDLDYEEPAAADMPVSATGGHFCLTLSPPGHRTAVASIARWTSSRDSDSLRVGRGLPARAPGRRYWTGHLPHRQPPRRS